MLNRLWSVNVPDTTTRQVGAIMFLRIQGGKPVIHAGVEPVIPER